MPIRGAGRGGLREGMNKFEPEKPVQEALAHSISQALKLLLSEKHLYQIVNVDVAFLDGIAEQKHRHAASLAAHPGLMGTGARFVPELKVIRAGLDVYLKEAWFPSNVAQLVKVGTDILYENDSTVQKYPLPTIKVTCNHCHERGPFNPLGALVDPAKLSESKQWISLSYQCQNCKREPVRFLVRRAGTKLTLSGRDPFETIEIPNYIPKQHAGNFRNALIASHAGQTLAGIFLMRVFVEQFWKSVPEVAAAVMDKTRPTGDELAEAYKSTLPSAFKERFPTLAEVYDSLSEAMHTARADADVFEKCHAQIIKHFYARRLFELVLPDSK